MPNKIRQLSSFIFKGNGKGLIIFGYRRMLVKEFVGQEGGSLVFGCQRWLNFHQKKQNFSRAQFSHYSIGKGKMTEGKC